MSLEKAVENISIHAPTRGATAAAPLTTAPSRISIHAPTRGATTCRIASFFTGRISIHAPTRGATLIDLFIRVFLDNFNPRSHEGSDGIHFVTPVVTVLFQSTLPRGERQDHKVKSFPLFEISIHAPTRGATVYPLLLHYYQEFQSTLPRGERRMIPCFLQSETLISIHAPTRGATQLLNI